jgi:hypothetical protein
MRMRFLDDRMWTVFAGGTLQIRVQFPAEAVPFALIGQIILLRLSLPSYCFASLSINASICIINSFTGGYGSSTSFCTEKGRCG